MVCLTWSGGGAGHPLIMGLVVQPPAPAGEMPLGETLNGQASALHSSSLPSVCLNVKKRCINAAIYHCAKSIFIT